MFTTELYQQGLDEYAQLAWQSSNKIGSAVTTCSNSYTAVACEYNPWGDAVFNTTYDIGDPCTTDGQCAGCVCSKDESLCIPPSTKATISWLQELQVFGVPENNIVVAPNEHKTGHYMQVVWQWTYQVDCAINYCTKNKPWPWTIAGCNYNPSGDNPYWVVYEMGDPCTTEADCRCRDCICSKDEALRIPPQYVPLPPTTTSTTTLKPTSHQLMVLITRDNFSAGPCPGLNDGMTGEVRKTFVDKHNEIGQAKGKAGQFAPKAARMLNAEMRWIGPRAVHSDSAMLKRWGNNMHMLSPKTDNKTEAAIASVDAWFGQLEKNGVPEKNVFTINNYMTLSKYSQTERCWPRVGNEEQIKNSNRQNYYSTNNDNNAEFIVFLSDNGMTDEVRWVSASTHNTI
uniref:SCP domain-containing protein n=1 Tax=Haemonchus contortus TaxID=6289 RepID=A0A7I4YVY0_HAECO